MATTCEVRYLGTTVDSDKIHLLFSPVGPVGKFVTLLSNRIRRNAPRFAPTRTGQLGKKVRLILTHSTKTTAKGGVRFYAGHAPIVMVTGSKTPILPQTSRYLRLPAGNGYPTIYTRQVSGQLPQKTWIRNLVNYSATQMKAKAL